LKTKKYDIYFQSVPLTLPKTAVLIVAYKLVSWDIIMKRDVEYPLHCHLEMASGPIPCLLQWALSAIFPVRSSSLTWIYIYIYIYKDLLHRDSWKYMLGYKIFPTTNLQHYHFGYSCE